MRVAMTEPRNSDEKRVRIRTAAYRCFRDRGYHETTVDDICREAGPIAKGSFYWHFASKQQVFIDILEAWTREVMNELYDQFESAVSREDYTRGIQGALERELHRGRVIVPLWLEFTMHARRDPDIQSALSKFYRRARTAIAEILRPLVTNVVPEHEMHAIATAVFGAYVGIVMQNVADPEHADGARAVAAVMSLIERLSVAA